MMCSKKLLVLVLVFGILTLNCRKEFSENTVHSLGKIEFLQNKDQINKEILKHIPVNSPIDRAKRIMELNGFECRVYVNATFKERKNLDFLFCYKKVTNWFWVEQIHQIAIIHKNGLVTEVDSRLLIRSPLD